MGYVGREREAGGSWVPFLGLPQHSATDWMA